MDDTGQQSSTFFLLSVFDMFYDLESQCALLAKNYSPSFSEAALTPTVCYPFHTPVPMDTSRHLAAASSIPADVLHCLCMLGMNCPFCM